MLSLSQQNALWHLVQKRFQYHENDWQILYLNHQPLGRISESWKTHLLTDAHPFIENHPNHCHIVCDNWQKMGDFLQQMAQKWHNEQLYSGWRNEQYDVRDDEGEGSAVFALERSVFRPLGLYSHAVHINGFCETKQGRRYWIGKRSPHKNVDANRLDNLTGGGVSAGETPNIAMQRELWEEAGLTLNQIQIVSQHTYRSTHTSHRGLHREILHVYDILLPENITPQNQDGEVAQFFCFNLNEAIDEMLADKFTTDALLSMLVHFHHNRWLHPEHPLQHYLGSIQC